MEPVERHVTLPLDTVQAWELLAHPDDLAAWLGEEVDLRLEPGATGRVRDDGTERCVVVEEVDEGRRVTWRWWADGGSSDHRDEASATRVEITLLPAVDGTVVRVVERPIATSLRACVTSEAWSRRFVVLELIAMLAAVLHAA